MRLLRFLGLGWRYPATKLRAIPASVESAWRHLLSRKRGRGKPTCRAMRDRDKTNRKAPPMLAIPASRFFADNSGCSAARKIWSRGRSRLEKKLWGPKELAGLYDPGEGAPVDDPERERDDLIQANENDAWEKILQRRRETMYATIGVNINGEEVEIPVWDENMTPEQAEEAARDRIEMGLSPFASDMELEATQDAVHPPTPEELRKRAMKEHYDEPTLT